MMPKRTKTRNRRKTVDGMKKVDDVVLKGAKPNDIIIPVMGPTGFGKSTFINAAVGKVVTPVGHELQMCTQHIQHAICECPGDPFRRVVLVDTPGFDDTLMSDTEILRRVAVWLTSSYGDGMKLAGVLYLHDISQPRMFGKLRRNLDMFRRLCGENAKKNVILATTKWSDIDAGVGERREEQLESKFWREMVENGSQVVRFDGSHGSAWDVINHILANNAAVDTARTQEERLDFGRTTKWKGQDRIKKVDDVVLKGARPNDIIIPVMGLTGIGKSTFINAAVGKDTTPVGHDLPSCTQHIQHAICACPGDPSRRVVLVDTPGFDNTFIKDSEILRRIAVWLASSYADNMKLAGVLYLHDISQSRMFGTSYRNLDMFRRLCGENAEKNVVLVTTKWNDVGAGVGERREQQLKDNFWKEMVKNGSQVDRFDGSHGSAWDVINHILANNAAAVDAVRIQEELVDLGRMIPETDAGTTLRAALKEVAEVHRRAVERLKGKVGNDEQRQRLKETEKEIRELLKQIQELKVPLGMGIKSWFGLG